MGKTRVLQTDLQVRRRWFVPHTTIFSRVAVVLMSTIRTELVHTNTTAQNVSPVLETRLLTKLGFALSLPLIQQQPW